MYIVEICQLCSLSSCVVNSHQTLTGHCLRLFFKLQSYPFLMALLQGPIFGSPKGCLIYGALALFYVTKWRCSYFVCTRLMKSENWVTTWLPERSIVLEKYQGWAYFPIQSIKKSSLISISNHGKSVCFPCCFVCIEHSIQWDPVSLGRHGSKGLAGNTWILSNTCAIRDWNQGGWVTCYS